MNNVEPAWESFSSRLRGYLRRELRNDAEAQDVLQDIFLRLYQNDDIIEPKHLGPWLFRAARNSVIDRFRRKRLSMPLPEDLPAPGEDVDEEAARFEARLGKWLKVQIENLPASYREAIYMVDVKGISQRHAADTLSIPYSTLKSRVQRGRAQLRDALQRCCIVERDAQNRVRSVQPIQCCP